MANAIESLMERRCIELATPQKIADVAEIKERIESSEIAIASKYVGITVEQVTELRKQLREAGVEYKVYKNNLARRALRELEIEEAADFMEGPTAWAFSNDPVAPAKIFKAYAKNVDTVAMMGGVLGGKPVDASQLQALASLPSREQLLAQVVGTIAAPLRNMVGTLNALPRNLVCALDQIQKKKAEEEAA
jgi:large subunit ribosomal protein L10